MSFYYYKSYVIIYKETKRRSNMKVLVTGTSKGIGKSIATKFLEEGHDVIGFDILKATFFIYANTPPLEAT